MTPDEEVEALSDHLHVMIITHLHEEMEKNEFPDFYASNRFRSSMTGQAERVFDAQRSKDLDALRVYSLFHPSDPINSNDDRALASVIASVRAAGYPEVFPLVKKLNLTDAARLHSTLYQSVYSDFKEGIRPNETVLYALRSACALGSEAVAGYMRSNAHSIADMVTERGMTDHKEVIALVESLLVCDALSMAEGVL